MRSWYVAKVISSTYLYYRKITWSWFFVCIAIIYPISICVCLLFAIWMNGIEMFSVLSFLLLHIRTHLHIQCTKTMLHCSFTSQILLSSSLWSSMAKWEMISVLKYMARWVTRQKRRSRHRAFQSNTMIQNSDTVVLTNENRKWVCTQKHSFTNRYNNNKRSMYMYMSSIWLFC